MKFKWRALRRCVNIDRGPNGGRYWEVEVTKTEPGDYHKSGDVVILEIS